MSYDAKETERLIAGIRELLLPNAFELAVEDQLRSAAQEIKRLTGELEQLKSDNVRYIDAAAQEMEYAEELRSRLAEVERDAARIDYLERHPRLSEIHVNGKVEDCYLYGVAGAPGLKLREIIDTALAAEGNEK